MDQFLGSHVNRLDAKGRISIPAPFRNVLQATQASASIVLRRSHLHDCVDVWPLAMLQASKARLAQMDILDPAYDDIAARLYGDSFPAEPDKEGRIVVPGRYLQHANITDTVTLTGRGAYFQIWEPGAAERRLTEAYAKPARAAT
jgi:MraZ protein